MSSAAATRILETDGELLTPDRHRGNVLPGPALTNFLQDHRGPTFRNDRAEGHRIGAIPRWPPKNGHGLTDPGHIPRMLEAVPAPRRHALDFPGFPGTVFERCFEDELNVRLGKLEQRQHAASGNPVVDVVDRKRVMRVRRARETSRKGCKRYGLQSVQCFFPPGAPSSRANPVNLIRETARMDFFPSC